MKRTTANYIALVVLTAFLLSPLATVGQTRRRTASKPKSTASTAAAAASAARTAGATRVADQIKFLTKFIYLLGGVANGIAVVDEAGRRNEASPDLLKRNEATKATVRNSIQGFREGLDKLEIDFRSTPELQPYYIKLAGVAAGAATAEQQAASSQFDASGRTLLTVVNRLADVLVVMRQ